MILIWSGILYILSKMDNGLPRHDWCYAHGLTMGWTSARPRTNTGAGTRANLLVLCTILKGDSSFSWFEGSGLYMYGSSMPRRLETWSIQCSSPSDELMVLEKKEDEALIRGGVLEQRQGLFHTVLPREP